MNASVLLCCAIAGTEYLVHHLSPRVEDLVVMEYEDHHYFTPYDMDRIKNQYEQLAGSNKIILTTEKDATRLELHKEFIQAYSLPIFVLPVKVAFHDNDGSMFDQYIKDFLLKFKA